MRLHVPALSRRRVAKWGLISRAKMNHTSLQSCLCSFQPLSGSLPFPPVRAPFRIYPHNGFIIDTICNAAIRRLRHFKTAQDDIHIDLEANAHETTEPNQCHKAAYQIRSSEPLQPCGTVKISSTIVVVIIFAKPYEYNK